MEETKPFLSRWSSRKLEAKKEQTVQPSLPETQEEVLDVAELIKTLPSLESVTAGSDVSAFMQAWVPKDLQNSALRKLWVSDPMISDYVGEALDYAYDYNNPLEGSGFGSLPLGYDAMKYVNELLGNGKDKPIDEKISQDIAPLEALESSSLENEELEHEAMSADKEDIPLKIS